MPAWFILANTLMPIFLLGVLVGQWLTHTFG